MNHVSYLAGAVALLAVGGLIGAVTSYQLLDIKLTEGSGDLLGAAFGSALAVGGSAWLSGLGERRRSRQAKDALRFTYHPLLTAMAELGQTLEQAEEGKIRYTALERGVNKISDVDKEIDRKLSHMIPAFQAHGLPGVEVYNRLIELRNEAIAVAETGRNILAASTEDEISVVRSAYMRAYRIYQVDLERRIRSLP